MGRKSSQNRSTSANDATESTVGNGATDASDPTESGPSEKLQEQSAEENADQGGNAEVSEESAKTHDVEEVAEEKEVEEKPSIKKRTSVRISDKSKKQSSQTPKRPRSEKATGGGGDTQLKSLRTTPKKTVKTFKSTPKVKEPSREVSSANGEKTPKKSVDLKPKSTADIGKEDMNKIKKRRIRYRRPTAPKDLIIEGKSMRNPLLPQLRALLSGARGFVMGKRGGFNVKRMPKDSFAQMMSCLSKSPFELKTASLHTPEGLYSVTLILKDKTETTKTGTVYASNATKQGKESSVEGPNSTGRSVTPPSKSDFRSSGKKRRLTLTKVVDTIKERSRSVTRRNSISKQVKKK
ncbi:unnamed protein product [Hymenolepis diminuta]|uniref:Heterochromatin protein 1-binding protein 3 n=1 Tax=Hymenolepis diminuta TaxID=6216 RepID=A0A0R3SIU7_HYMDI|nr:unnamed protein product [Hymenolepis diminuta]